MVNNLVSIRVENFSLKVFQKKKRKVHFKILTTKCYGHLIFSYFIKSIGILSDYLSRLFIIQFVLNFESLILEKKLFNSFPFPDSISSLVRENVNLVNFLVTWSSLCLPFTFLHQWWPLCRQRLWGLSLVLFINVTSLLLIRK